MQSPDDPKVAARTMTVANKEIVRALCVLFLECSPLLFCSAGRTGGEAGEGHCGKGTTQGAAHGGEAECNQHRV